MRKSWRAERLEKAVQGRMKRSRNRVFRVHFTLPVLSAVQADQIFRTRYAETADLILE